MSAMLTYADWYAVRRAAGLDADPVLYGMYLAGDLLSGLDR